MVSSADTLFDQQEFVEDLLAWPEGDGVADLVVLTEDPLDALLKVCLFAWNACCTNVVQYYDEERQTAAAGDAQQKEKGKESTVKPHENILLEKAKEGADKGKKVVHWEIGGEKRGESEGEDEEADEDEVDEGNEGNEEGKHREEKEGEEQEEKGEEVEEGEEGEEVEEGEVEVDEDSEEEELPKQKKKARKRKGEALVRFPKHLKKGKRGK